MDIGIPNFDFFQLVEACGFPIALAVVCGWFIQQAISLRSEEHTSELQSH